MFVAIDVEYSTPILQRSGAGVLDPGDSGGGLLLDGSPRTLIGVNSEVVVAGMERTDTWAAPDASVLTWVNDLIDPGGDSRIDMRCPSGVVSSIDPTLTDADDADGDWAPDGTDTCPGVYNPCQVAGDADGDGTPDDCDACATDANVAQPRYDAALTDGDGDGLPDRCDCTPAFFSLLSDQDGDGAYRACDNCPAASNPLQEDCDRNLVGDACQDYDRDGVLDLCGAGDDCVGVSNPAIADEQPNCNLDAEEAALDACLATGRDRKSVV
jgi:hypothetical protein